MSRVGKQPIAIPHGVDIKLNENVVQVIGPKGEFSYSLPEKIKASVIDNNIVLERTSDTKVVCALHGLARSLVSNMVNGVSKGYEMVLEITGVGYRAQVNGNRIVFTLGYSHPVDYELPAGVMARVDEKQTKITLSSIDKQLMGQVAANIKELRPPDAYKGKGVRYAGERIKLKAGKTGKK